MKVSFVDPLCDKRHFTDLENLLLRADVASNQLVSASIGSLLDSADSCDNRVFQVIGRCLSLAAKDNTVVITLDASDDGDCQTAGIY
jgi:hypothetical protein